MTGQAHDSSLVPVVSCGVLEPADAPIAAVADALHLLQHVAVIARIVLHYPDGEMWTTAKAVPAGVMVIVAAFVHAHAYAIPVTGALAVNLAFVAVIPRAVNEDAHSSGPAVPVGEIGASPKSRALREVDKPLLAERPAVGQLGGLLQSTIEIIA